MIRILQIWSVYFHNSILMISHDLALTIEVVHDYAMIMLAKYDQWLPGFFWVTLGIIPRAILTHMHLATRTRSLISSLRDRPPPLKPSQDRDHPPCQVWGQWDQWCGRPLITYIHLTNIYKITCFTSKQQIFKVMHMDLLFSFSLPFCHCCVYTLQLACWRNEREI